MNSTSLALPASVALRFVPPRLPPEPPMVVLASILRLYANAAPDPFTSALVAHQLQEIADHLPCEKIPGSDGSIYMRRYLVAEMRDGSRIDLNELCRPDEDAEHHSHPRRHGRALILAYGYEEERLMESSDGRMIITTTFEPGMTNPIDADDFHRISKLNGPCSWSLFFVSGKAERADGEDSWSFKDPATGKVTGYKAFLADKAARIAHARQR